MGNGTIFGYDGKYVKVIEDIQYNSIEFILADWMPPHHNDWCIYNCYVLYCSEGY